MNPPILNRESKVPADGWHQFEVPGEHINHAAKVVQVIDPLAIASIVNRFQADAAKPNFAGLLIDKDHFSLDPDQTSEAMGWAMEVRNRDGIPEARIDWTAAGRPKIEGKDYKFFSTVYNPHEVEPLGTRIVNGKPYQIVRPLHLDRLALTNDPNNKGGKPISNRGAETVDAAHPTQIKMKSVAKALGLAEDASEESIHAAVQKIQNRATQAEASVSTLTAERDTLAAAVVEADLEKYKNRFKPENREKVKAQLVKNRAATIELLEATEAPAADTKRITNRSGAQSPAEKTAEASLESKRDAAVAQYKITNRCTFQEAWEATRNAQPALFADPVAAE